VVALFARHPLSESILDTLASVVDIIAQGIERRRAEEALRSALDEIQKSESKLRQVIDTIPALAWCNLPDGPNEFLNKGWHEYTGLSEEQSHGWGWQAAFHPDDLPPLMEKWTKMLVSGVPDEIEARLRRHDGVYRWFLIRAEPFRNESGNIVRWYGTSTDIEDLKKAEEALRASERNLVATINTIPTTAWTTRPDGYCDFLNQVWLDYAGMTAEQAQGWGWAEAIHPDDREKLVEVWQSCLASGTPVDTEARIQRFDGSYRWFMIRANPLRDESGNILKWYGTCTDIEDRKRAEEALRARELEARSLLDNMPGLVVRLSPDGTPEIFNRPFLQYLGKTSEEIGQWRVNDIVHPHDLAHTTEVFGNGIARGQQFDIEYRLRRFDGIHRWFLARLIPVRNAEGRILHWNGLVTDIEDRKRAEEALRARELDVRSFFDNMPGFLARLSPDGALEMFNPPFLQYLGRTLEEIDQWRMNDTIHPDDLAHVIEVFGDGLSTGKPFDFEYRIRRFDGVYRWFQSRMLPVRNVEGQILHWNSIATDIDDRKKAEVQLEQAFAQLTEAQRLSQTGSFTWDVQKDEHTWSSEIYRIFGLESGTKVTMQMIQSTIHPEDMPVVEATIGGAAEGADFDLLFRIVTPSGVLKHAHAVGHRVERIADRPVFLGAVQDVTESKSAEEALNRARSELAHMARVTTLSALTASIAHEVNQPISAVTTSAGACLRWLNRDQPDVQRAREAAMRIEDDGRRAAEIISHLKYFYKKDVSPQREMVSVNELVGEMLMLLRSEADHHSVLMRTELAADLPSVSADRVLLQQVLMNLMLNGMEAMSERGGELKVSTQREDREARVSVSDTGVGIPADKMDQIFKAFVTTKAGGTGMGLAISSTIVESHGGRLWATANADSGATFHFSLPTDLRH
jgi:PAS domain S-box-containing protein